VGEGPEEEEAEPGVGGGPHLRSQGSTGLLERMP
jgi:hypothetical protein